MSILRIRVWHAPHTFNPARSSKPVPRYRSSCVKNQAKDLVKKRWRTRSSSTTSALTGLEREIFVRLYRDLTQRQVVAVTLSMSRTEMQRSMRSSREKLSALPQRALVA